MLRLAPQGFLRFSQANSFDAIYGGGESNVAVSLANYGVDVDFVTRLPKNDIGECAMMEMRKRGVGVDKIVYGGDRLGIYFLETGAVFAPYIPLIMTPLVYDPNTFTPRKGLLTRYAKKMVRPEFYGTIEINGLNTL